jgi:hypothetical protein
MIRYPAGSYKPSALPVGGTGFYAKPFDVSKAKTITLQYRVFFPGNFSFVKGGKLPGLFGKLSWYLIRFGPLIANGITGGKTTCSGGDDANDCFSSRFMVILDFQII